MSIQQEKFKEIADAIRSKTGNTDLIYPSQFASEINNVYTAGKEKSQSDIWDAITENGNRKNYNYAFAAGNWNNRNFNPTRDIKCSEKAERMFWMFNYYGGDAFDLVEHLKSLPNKNKESGYGIDLDFTDCTLYSYMCYYAKITRLGVLDMRKATASYGNSSMFSQSAITTVDKIISSEDTDYTNAFVGASKLVDLEFEGVIGKDIDLSQCVLLTKESIVSAITHLSDNAVSKTLSFRYYTITGKDWTNTVINGVTYNTFDEICDLKQNWTISLV